MKITKNTTIFRDLDGGRVIMNTQRLEEVRRDPDASIWYTTRDAAIWYTTREELQIAAHATNNGENFEEVDGIRIFRLVDKKGYAPSATVTFGNFEANGIYWIGCRHFGRTTFRRILRKAGVSLE